MVFNLIYTSISVKYLVDVDASMWNFAITFSYMLLGIILEKMFV